MMVFTEHNLMHEYHPPGDKIVLLVMDGLGGLPLTPTGQTELETAQTPNLDQMAREGSCGLSGPVRAGIEPGSDVYRIAGELGYWLTPPRWGQGIMQRVLRHYVTAMAPVLGLRRVFARVYEGNLASMRVLERCGFEREGIERGALIKHGQVLDAHLYARCFDAAA